MVLLVVWYTGLAKKGLGMWILEFCVPKHSKPLLALGVHGRCNKNSVLVSYVLLIYADTRKLTVIYGVFL